MNAAILASTISSKEKAKAAKSAPTLGNRNTRNRVRQTGETAGTVEGGDMYLENEIDPERFERNPHLTAHFGQIDEEDTYLGGVRLMRYHCFF